MGTISLQCNSHLFSCLFLDVKLRKIDKEAEKLNLASAYMVMQQIQDVTDGICRDYILWAIAWTTVFFLGEKKDKEERGCNQHYGRIIYDHGILKCKVVKKSKWKGWHNNQRKEARYTPFTVRIVTAVKCSRRHTTLEFNQGHGMWLCLGM